MSVLLKESPSVHRRLSEARLAVEGGRPEKALRPLARALSEDPACAYAWFYRAAIRTLLRDPAGAASDLSALGRLPVATVVRYREFDAPSSLRYPRYGERVDRLLAGKGKPPAWAHVLRAFALREHHRFSEAIAAMEKAVAAAPRDAGLRGLLSRVRFVNRFPKKGLSDLDSALRLAPTCGWLHAWRGEALRHLGRADAAHRSIEKALVLDPGYFRAYAWRGGLRAARGRHDLALADFDRALKSAPPDEPSLSWIFNERARARRALGDVAGALADLNAAHTLNSRYAWVRPGGDCDAAGGELTRFLRLRPRHAWARAWRGHTWLEAQRPSEALADLGAAASTGKAWPLVWRARARLMLADSSGALADLTRAVKKGPGYAPAWAWRGGVRRLLGQTAGARQDLGRAVALDPILAWAWAWRGELELSEGRLQEAISDLRRALTLDPDSHDARLWSSQALRLSRRPDEALADVTAARRLRPESWRTWAELSLVLAMLGDDQGQRRALARALKLAPPQALS